MIFFTVPLRPGVASSHLHTFTLTVASSLPLFLSSSLPLFLSSSLPLQTHTSTVMVFLQHCVYRRMLFSPEDALYACKVNGLYHIVIMVSMICYMVY
jgi:hypothetical protein